MAPTGSYRELSHRGKLGVIGLAFGEGIGKGNEWSGGRLGGDPLLRVDLGGCLYLVLLPEHGYTLWLKLLLVSLLPVIWLSTG